MQDKSDYLENMKNKRKLQRQKDLWGQFKHIRVNKKIL